MRILALVLVLIGFMLVVVGYRNRVAQFTGSLRG